MGLSLLRHLRPSFRSFATGSRRHNRAVPPVARRSPQRRGTAADGLPKIRSGLSRDNRGAIMRSKRDSGCRDCPTLSACTLIVRTSTWKPTGGSTAQLARSVLGELRPSYLDTMVWVRFRDIALVESTKPTYIALYDMLRRCFSAVDNSLLLCYSQSLSGIKRIGKPARRRAGSWTS